MKVRAIEIEKNQKGYTCKFWIMVSGAQQFSDAELLSISHGTYWVTALWNAWRDARKVHRIHTATKQERKAKGWA